MLKLSDQDLKAAMIKMHRQAITNVSEANEKIESLVKEIGLIKKNQKFWN